MNVKKLLESARYLNWLKIPKEKKVEFNKLRHNLIYDEELLNDTKVAMVEDIENCILTGTEISLIRPIMHKYNVRFLKVYQDYVKLSEFIYDLNAN